MDRTIEYVGQIPLAEQALARQQNTAVALAAAIDAVMGIGVTVADQFALTFSGLTVTVGQGSITSGGPMDPAGYGPLPQPAQNTSIQYLFSGSQAFTLPAGATTNIYATLVTQDASPVVLPYYNAGSPAQPFAGQGNSGASQPTVRQNTITLSTTASAGAVLLYTIVVPPGVTAVTSAMVTLSSAFLPYKLPQIAAMIGNFVRKTGDTVTGPLVSVATSGQSGFSVGVAPQGQCAGFFVNAPNGYANYLFQAQINGTNAVYIDQAGNLNVATSAFVPTLSISDTSTKAVNGATLAKARRLIGVQKLTSGTGYTPTAGATYARVRIGGPGGGAPACGTPQDGNHAVVTSSGGAGGYIEAFGPINSLPSTNGVIAIHVGAPGDPTASSPDSTSFAGFTCGGGLSGVASGQIGSGISVQIGGGAGGTANPGTVPAGWQIIVARDGDSGLNALVMASATNAGTVLPFNGAGHVFGRGGFSSNGGLASPPEGFCAGAGGGGVGGPGQASTSITSTSAMGGPGLIIVEEYT